MHVRNEFVRFQPAKQYCFDLARFGFGLYWFHEFGSYLLCLTDIRLDGVPRILQLKSK